MKKYLIVFVTNIILLFLFFSGYEFYCFNKEKTECIESSKTVNQFWKDKLGITEDVVQLRYKPTHKFTLEELNERMQVYKGNNPSKTSVVFIGCSFAEGLEIEPQKRVSALLTDITGRTSYNLGIPATAINWFYKRLKLSDGKLNFENPEYFIYIYIQDHIRRLFSYETLMYNENVRYKIKDNKLIERHSVLNDLYILYSIKQLCNKISLTERYKEIEQGYPLFNKIIEESKNLVSGQYNNSKFIFIDYPEKGYNNKLPEEEIKKLEKMGIIYINAEELLGHTIYNDESYWSGDNIHPSSKAWGEFVPKLVEKLGL